MYDLWQELISTIRRNKMRTALTGFAVAWGIFMLIVLLGAGNGLNNAFLDNGARWSVNSVKSGGSFTTKPYAGFDKGRYIQLHNKDIVATQTLKDNVGNVGGIHYSGGQTVSYADQSVSGTIIGCDANYENIEKINVLYGRFINIIDVDQKRKSIVLPENLAKKLFKHPERAVGQHVKLTGLMYLVVGVTKTDQQNSDDDFFVPRSTFALLNNTGDRVDQLLFSIHNIKNEADCDQFEKKFRSVIAHQERFDPEDTGGVWVWNRFSRYLDQMKGAHFITVAIWIIALFTMISGIVGVSNIMLIAVKERTKEFGIRKALGATPRSILWMIIAESVFITTLFGYIGLVAGVGVTELMDATIGHQTMNAGVFQMQYFKNPTVDIHVAIQATLTLIICGTLAGYFPALKAVKVPPIEALRAE